MSDVREALLRNLRGYEPCGEDDGTDPAAQLLDRYRAEILREAAQEFKGLAPGYFHANDVSALLEGMIPLIEEA